MIVIKKNDKLIRSKKCKFEQFGNKKFRVHTTRNGKYQIVTFYGPALEVYANSHLIKGGTFNRDSCAHVKWVHLVVAADADVRIVWGNMYYPNEIYVTVKGDEKWNRNWNWSLY